MKLFRHLKAFAVFYRVQFVRCCFVEFQIHDCWIICVAKVHFLLSLHCLVFIEYLHVGRRVNDIVDFINVTNGVLVWELITVLTIQVSSIFRPDIAQVFMRFSYRLEIQVVRLVVQPWALLMVVIEKHHAVFVL